MQKRFLPFGGFSRHPKAHPILPSINPMYESHPGMCNADADQQENTNDSRPRPMKGQVKERETQLDL
ncbi:hypothetical protein VTL71DRAFT_8686 [Oculimacula yallundae]|uniref:Uncharacterized protein n=1 Tax=Oculimacula yallundae TaxID=86028 RepID=A0ABR4CYG8_9HELO